MIQIKLTTIPDQRCVLEVREAGTLFTKIVEKELKLWSYLAAKGASEELIETVLQRLAKTGNATMFIEDVT
jgi:hypothetical protein